MPPVPAAIASAHFRIASAGQNAQAAIQSLKARQVLRGRVSLQQVVSDLQHAADYLTAYGQAPNLTAYVKTLVQFYEGQLSSALRPAQAPTIAEILAANQGNLLASDPVLFPAVVN